MVELLSHFGDDLMVVNAARVSFGKSKEILDKKDENLINYLVEHNHNAPFRHPQLQFRITCPIYVERQLFKHQVGLSANSISGRYVDFSDSYTKIKEWRKQSKSSKQGSEGFLDTFSQEVAYEIENEVIEKCKSAYRALLDLGVSKEQARTILPLNLNTSFIWTGSFLAFIHLWRLRTKSDTQHETRDIAGDMLKLVKEIEGNPFKHTLAAWGYEASDNTKL
jgi:thymidylate synthase (FAD)